MAPLRSSSAKRCGAALAAGFLALALGACEADKVPLPGERVSVLQLNTELNVDPTLAETPVRLPRPYENSDWPQSGGNQAHAMYHLSAGTGVLKQIWTANIGSSADSANRLLAEPDTIERAEYTESQLRGLERLLADVQHQTTDWPKGCSWN